MINLYGSSEVAADVTSYEVTAPDQRAGIPIGRPIDNTQAYILDGAFKPVPVGVCGELYIAGAGLARGYFDRPELTAERFLPNPFSSARDARMFRSGDLARYRPDGTIEFLGRADYQVKIRGFRVEVGEIEEALGKPPTVRRNVVVVHEDMSGDRRVVAYIVPFAEGKIDLTELRAFVQRKLPEYMIPSALVELPDLPLTPSGKINRRALPAPEFAAQLEQNYLAPRTEVEELLSGVWAEVLKVGRVGRQAPLKSIPAMASHYLREMREVQPAGPYLLGGHSLGGMIAFEMACQLREHGEQVDLVALLDAYPLGHYKLQPNANSRTYLSRRFGNRIKCHFYHLVRLPGKEKFAYLLDKAQFAPAKIKQQLWRRAYRLRRFNRALPATLRNIEGLNFLAAREYLPRIYPGRVALFWASGDLTTSFDLLDGWRTLAAGGVDVHEISGNHINIVKEPHVSALADEFRGCLDQSHEEQSAPVRAA